MRDKNSKHLESYRKKLRRNMTAVEVALWQMLRNRQLDGVRFFRQYSIGIILLISTVPGTC